MPIPETITQADKDRWTASWNEFWDGGHAAKAGLPPHMKDDRLIERLWWNGEWLAQELREAGASPDEVHEINFNCGRRNVFAPDPWVSAVQALEDYKQGVVNRNIPEMSLTDDAVTIVTDGNRSVV